jgi:hypothetical protein
MISGRWVNSSREFKFHQLDKRRQSARNTLFIRLILVIEVLTKRSNKVTRSYNQIVQPLYVQYVRSPHNCVFLTNNYAANENMKIVRSLGSINVVCRPDCLVRLGG